MSCRVGHWRAHPRAEDFQPGPFGCRVGSQFRPRSRLQPPPPNCSVRRVSPRYGFKHQAPLMLGTVVGTVAELLVGPESRPLVRSSAAQAQPVGLQAPIRIAVGCALATERPQRHSQAVEAASRRLDGHARWPAGSFTDSPCLAAGVSRRAWPGPPAGDGSGRQHLESSFVCKLGRPSQHFLQDLNGRAVRNRIQEARSAGSHPGHSERIAL